MTRIKSVFGALVVVALVSMMPQAKAQTLKVVLAGSSAQWQSLALAAYNGNTTGSHCVSGGTAPCFHYTNSSFNLNDTRPTTKGGTTAVDSGNIWIIWDSDATPNVWAFIKVDSGVGDRCYFAQPHCNISVTTFPSPGNLISSSLWGDNSSDSTPPTSIQNLFTAAAGVLVNAAATDIRPEDALFATCRANSKLGNSTTSTDGLGGLGYNTNNASGVCPAFGAPLANLEGSDIQSAYPGSTATAHLLAWNISGRDPFTGTAIPAPTTVSVGAAAVVPIFSRSNALLGAENATDAQLQAIFSGANCNGNELAGAAGGAISVYLREPVSGTMNTTESTVFRYVNETGASQETGVGAQNPLSATCAGGGGSRYRAIGTGESVKSVLNSNTNHGNDGIAYAFFSYGNISSIANSASYGYLQLDGIDGIFHVYCTTGTCVDPGQPAGGVLPAAANLPATCAGGAGNFPCAEGDIWSGHLSLPNLRNGSYRAWSDLRTVSNGAALTLLETLVTGAQTYVVNDVPDFVPAQKVGATDPGLPLLRSHYLQEGVNPINLSTTGDKGGDMGGCILTNTGTVATSDTTTKLIQQAPGTGCVVYTN
jgi:hypothetical protein